MEKEIQKNTVEQSEKGNTIVEFMMKKMYMASRKYFFFSTSVFAIRTKESITPRGIKLSNLKNLNAGYHHKSQDCYLEKKM